MRWVRLLLAAGAVVWAQDAPKFGAVHGVVTDEVTGLPMSGVLVQAFQRRQSPDGAVLMVASGRNSKSTDEQGRYAIANVPPGMPVIMVNAAKHGSASRMVSVAANQDVEVNFSIPANPEIAGRVLDESRKPVKSASVWMIQSYYGLGRLQRSQAVYVSTDKDGRFLFDERLEAGRAYYLVAKGQAGLPTFYGGSTSLEAAAPLVLGNGERREQTDIVLHAAAATYCVEGTVHTGGKPLGTDLTIEQSALAGAGIALEPHVQSADDGTFRTCGLAAGDYTISGPDRHFHDQQSFTIADSDVHGIQLNLDPARVRRELVWDGDPPPEPAAEPAAAESAVEESLSSLDIASMTDDQFRRRLQLPMGSEVKLLLKTSQFRARIPYSDTAPLETSAGDFPLSVELAPGCYVKEITYAGVPVIDGVLHLSPGSSGTLRIVAAQGGGTISAKVEDGDAHPVGDAVVVVVPDRVETAPQFPALASQADADPNGNFTSATLAPGQYRVLALARRYQPTEEDIDKLLALLPSAQKVEVGRNSNERVTLHTVPME